LQITARSIDTGSKFTTFLTKVVKPLPRFSLIMVTLAEIFSIGVNDASGKFNSWGIVYLHFNLRLHTPSATHRSIQLFSGKFATDVINASSNLLRVPTEKLTCSILPTWGSRGCGLSGTK
jgi:hypothetical protein